jgi:UDP-N-acetylglucosamine--N-acetylmuramyl-(pentapeptide) pyrophosphoryl-undecaprenol N-acetylglucosamine transferase
LPSRVYAAVFGSGLGHVTRVDAIANSLQKTNNCEFLYSSFDEAYDYLKKYKRNVNYAPSVDVKWNLTGGFSGSDTIIRFPYAFSGFGKQISFEIERISDFNPRVVLSDSRLSAVFAAKARFYPVVTILNQIRILFPPRFRKGHYGDLLERMEADMLGLFWSASNEILFPDLPPPFTIGEANISNVDVANKVTFTGFMIPKTPISAERLTKARSLLQLDNRPIVFMQISGPNATKAAFVDSALESAAKLALRYNVIVSKGLPAGSTLPSRLAGGAWIYDWCPIKDELFALSDVLVARSGHTTISQCISVAKPSVLIPIFNHSEQIWNAQKFERLGLGISIMSQRLTAERLEHSVDSCIEDSKFKESMQKLKSISDRYDGIKAASEVLKEFL